MLAEHRLIASKHQLPMIERIRAGGITSLRGIAAVLDARGVRTARGGKWKAIQVGAVVRRAGLKTPS